jgi:RNA polymerase sigma-70 factor, ECF subfamily
VEGEGVAKKLAEKTRVCGIATRDCSSWVAKMEQHWWITANDLAWFMTPMAYRVFLVNLLPPVQSLAGGMQSHIILVSRQGRPRQYENVPPPSVPENQLLARAQAGEEEAFACLFETHKRKVYSLCLRMTGDPAEAEDLSQEAFLNLFRKISTFRGEAAFSTWLHRLVVNVVLMYLRKRGPQKVSMDCVENWQEEPVKREYGEDDRNLLGSVDRLTLTSAVERLPPGCRAIFVLHDIEGYEHSEIARMMNCTVGNSKSQLHKARLKLRAGLQRSQNPGSGHVGVATEFAL